MNYLDKIISNIQDEEIRRYLRVSKTGDTLGNVLVGSCIEKIAKYIVELEQKIENGHN